VSLLVVGVIHGNEQFGLGVISRLNHMSVPAGVALWVIPEMNPDGVAADSRYNAHGVDLNRNFPYEWSQSSTSGSKVLSEPESKAMAAFLDKYRPHTVVIFHSPFDAVDYSQGADPAAVRYLAKAAGFAAKDLGPRPGELTGWYNGSAWHPSAITFEFASHTSSAQLSRVARAVMALAEWRVS
jgi:murein peptide amidase A